MPILIDMKKKAGVADTWEGQVYNAKDGQLYSSTIKPAAPTSSRFKAACSASCAAVKPGPASVRQFPASPVNSMAKGSTEERRRSAAKTPQRATPPQHGTAEDHRSGERGAEAPVRSWRPASPAISARICLLPDIARFAH